MALTRGEKQIEKAYDAARKQALKKVEKMARAILKKHPRLDEFIMGMGSYFFTIKGNEDTHVTAYTKRMNKSWQYYYVDTYEYLKPLNDFVGRWDKVLKLTGEPMRFTVDGPIETNW